MRKRKALINIVVSLILEFVTVLSGLIVPRLFIGSYGSEVNGLINSITSFIAYITLLQSGVGSVIKSALFKPLAQKDHDQLCKIVVTSNAFFRKIALATAIYIGILMVAFPLFIAKNYDWIFTSSLVVIIGVSTAAQYFFGITYQMLLEADQRAYIYSLIQIVTVILNTIACVVLINQGQSVQIVKLVSSVFFVARPFVLGEYVKYKYQLNRKANADNSLISQRWDGFAQAIAYFIHSKTDVFVLTVFASLTEVSIYSVYALVTSGLASLINAIDKAVRSAFGNIIASDEHNNLINSFNVYNTLIHIFTTTCFATASITIFRFVTVYVSHVKDADYVRPIFGLLIITAEMFYCLRSPYNSIIFAAGKFKETKNSAWIEAGLNIVISIILVRRLGLIGVAGGTLVAMVYRTFAFILYLNKEILMLSVWSQVRRVLTTVISYTVAIASLSRINISVNSYGTWIVYAAIIFALAFLEIIIINLLLENKNSRVAIRRFAKR
jgi:O-antigen/teichoic acid export membrane protein